LPNNLIPPENTKVKRVIAVERESVKLQFMKDLFSSTLHKNQYSFYSLCTSFVVSLMVSDVISVRLCQGYEASWQRVNGSTPRQPFPCTHPFTPNWKSQVPLWNLWYDPTGNRTPTIIFGGECTTHCIAEPGLRCRAHFRLKHQDRECWCL